jgi:methionine-gamma-lyase
MQNNSNITKIIHNDYDNLLSEGSLVTPIFKTSTFCFDKAENGKRAFELAYHLDDAKENEVPSLIYTRVNNPNMEILENKLKYFDNTEASLIFSSGMAAISNTLLSLLEKGDSIIYSNPVYGGTHSFLNNILPKYDINVHEFPAGSDETYLEEYIKNIKNIKIFFIETPCNPLLKLTSLKTIKNIINKYCKDCLLVVDNTMNGPEFFKPSNFGADLIIYSITKFIGGHSDIIAGSVSGPKNLIDKIKVTRTIFGSVPGPDTCWLIQRSLPTVHLRMREQQKNCIEIYKFLKDHVKIKKIYYPGHCNNDVDDYQQQIFKEEYTGNGSIISFDLENGEEECFMFLNKLKIIKLAVSLGSVESLAQHPSTMTHSNLTKDDKSKVGITDNLIRLSIGIEDIYDLINDLKNALE